MPHCPTLAFASIAASLCWLGTRPAAATEPPAAPPSPVAPAPPTAPACKAATPEFHEGTLARHERFNQIAKEGKAQLVFLGDSITQGWEGAGKDVWAVHFAARSAANFGIGGDRTEHVLWRIDHGNFDGLHPKLIVIMIGTNNAGARKDPPDDTAAGVKAILDRLAVKCPDAKVLLLGIFPRGKDPSDAMRKINDGVNARLAKFADDQRVFYKDIGGQFMDASGNVSKDVMPDLLHLSTLGYELWTKGIEADVARLMGEAKG